MLEQHLARVRGEALVRRRFRGGPGPSEARGEVRRVGRGIVCRTSIDVSKSCFLSVPFKCLACLYSGHSCEGNQRI